MSENIDKYPEFLFQHNIRFVVLSNQQCKYYMYFFTITKDLKYSDFKQLNTWNQII